MIKQSARSLPPADCAISAHPRRLPPPSTMRRRGNRRRNIAQVEHRADHDRAAPSTSPGRIVHSASHRSAVAISILRRAEYKPRALPRPLRAPTHTLIASGYSYSGSDPVEPMPGDQRLDSARRATGSVRDEQHDRDQIAIHAIGFAAAAQADRASASHLRAEEQDPAQVSVEQRGAGDTACDSQPQARTCAPATASRVARARSRSASDTFAPSARTPPPAD